MAQPKSIDCPSILGQFGWEMIGAEELALPVILRSNDARYSPVRIVEQEIIRKYPNIPQSVFQCISLKTFLITPSEAKLLNNINFNHCNTRYGESFFNINDLIVSIAEIKELSRFLNLAYCVFNHELSRLSANIGVIRFVIDPSTPSYTCLVPYICKVYNGRPSRFIPSRLVEHYVKQSSMAVKAIPSPWDLTYLKMLTLFCDNNSQSCLTNGSQIVLLDGLLYSKTESPIIYEDWESPNC